MNHPTTSACACAGRTDEQRRTLIKAAATGIAAPLAFAAAPAHSTPVAGDRFVEEDAEGTPQPLRLADLKPGKPMLAFPFDAKRGVARDDSRLNKVVLIRLAESEMSAETRARSAAGVLAYSAICTHQACDVKTWVAKEQALLCFCHSSKFLLLDGAAVASGPATRPLPALPLALAGELLVVAGAFSAAPGGSAT